MKIIEIVSVALVFAWVAAVMALPVLLAVYLLLTLKELL